MWYSPFFILATNFYVPLNYIGILENNVANHGSKARKKSGNYKAIKRPASAIIRLMLDCCTLIENLILLFAELSTDSVAGLRLLHR
ncbi:hypothetical protein SAMN04487772_11360 [[Clostridium] polysaccharolyticum]|uniref:Uncharacterized protein n=1 Tax=[Clostridium] polysaccharolyticum TaxID=29364 RepID=A0A1I0DAQ9_9FIRM|nr:hypothetical protein SAMN04487772_11360 [[Clostridium] polysaccharolyticum]